MADNIGAAIKRLRASQDLTQYELATIAGVSDAMVAHVESGRRNLPPAMLEKIATGLGLDDAEVATLERLRAEGRATPSTPRADRLARLEAAVEALVEEQRALRTLLESRLPAPPDDPVAD